MAAQSALLSASEYLAGEFFSNVRHEFVAGSVYETSGASRRHGTITSNLAGILYRDLAGSKCRHLDQDTKVWVQRGSAYYYPDATISCPPHYVDDANGVIDNPTVVVEVLSPSTRTVDRGQKFAHYRSLESLRDYVLIESESVRVEVFSIEDAEWVVRCFDGLEGVAAIPSVGVSVRLAELYAQVVFDGSDPNRA